jgi:hypothetical protein
MSEMTILEGVKIIAERLENFPDEFNKWKHFVQWSVLDKESPLEDHEKAYLSDAYKKAERVQYNADVLKQIQDEPKLKYKTEGRYATLWNDPMTAFGSPQIQAEGQNIGYGTIINANNN